MKNKLTTLCSDVILGRSLRQPAGVLQSSRASVEQLLSSEREIEAHSSSGTTIGTARASLGSLNAGMTWDGGDVGS